MITKEAGEKLTGKEIKDKNKSSMDLAAKQWFELILETIQEQREMKIKTCNK